MYDPQDDYARDGSPSPAKPATPVHSLPFDRPVYCIRCGNALTDYTVVIVLHAAFCWHCQHQSEQRCIDALAILPLRRWHDILAVYANTLYLSPMQPEHGGRSLADLANAKIHTGDQCTLWTEQRGKALAFRG